MGETIQASTAKNAPSWSKGKFKFVKGGKSGLELEQRNTGEVGAGEGKNNKRDVWKCKMNLCISSMFEKQLLKKDFFPSSIFHSLYLYL